MCVCVSMEHTFFTVFSLYIHSRFIYALFTFYFLQFLTSMCALNIFNGKCKAYDTDQASNLALLVIEKKGRKIFSLTSTSLFFSFFFFFFFFFSFVRHLFPSRNLLCTYSDVRFDNRTCTHCLCVC